MTASLVSTTIRSHDGRLVESKTDVLAVEEPLEIRIRNRPFAVTMRTPGHDEELAIGFLVGEGLLRTREDLVDVQPCERNEFGNAVNVRPGPLVPVDFAAAARHVYTTSSCGVCGKASIEAVRARALAPVRGLSVKRDVLERVPLMLAQGQGGFAESGGLHAAAICDQEGRVVVLREDVGRHNAVDKAIGRMFLDGQVPLPCHLLMVSGRASFEIMQKAAMAGIGVVAAVSAPSSLAVQFAKEMNQTLVGFLRPPRFNVYSHPERIIGESP
jgi:FdhD protein